MREQAQLAQQGQHVPRGRVDGVGAVLGEVGAVGCRRLAVAAQVHQQHLRDGGAGRRRPVSNAPQGRQAQAGEDVWGGGGGGARATAGVGGAVPDAREL